MKKVAFHNLGCKVNSYELDGISQMFQKRGYEIVDFAQKADVYIVNTCTVTNIADHKSRQMLGRAKARNPEAIVVAAGCYVQNSLDRAVNDPSVDIAVGTNHKAEIVDIVEEYMEARKRGESTIFGPEAEKTLGGKTVSDLTKPCGYENLAISETAGHTRAYMKIQDGCDMFCSYCAIPYARGRSRSRSIEDIRDEAARLAENGYKEAVITGIHLSSYGIDRTYNVFAKENGMNSALIDAITAASVPDGIKRIRLGSLEPRLITEEFLKRLADNPKICPHFHLSLQSGCDSVLQRMNRHYSTAEYEEKVALIREFFAHPAVTTDVIVGFPGETEDEFEITRAFLEKIDLYECHVFKYSRRAGTAADKMKGQLTDAVKSARSALLITDSQKRTRKFMSFYAGKCVEVLTEDTENIDGMERTVGYTPEYVKCSLPVTASGQITEILCFDRGCDTIIDSGRSLSLYGEPIAKA
ncbi:MAG: tRNA (N(6)-L-threonylcarbamoyladenosine(37)-C(2))-methylthiotransferase MtaB [Lachnospiraceae bacterium]|nr:tRNA (N(6)-L-threonylcarbamoyladenosine(37)-C(2))-methylthiotransferase MtaB [Lachnospiraceae bacterium]